MSWGSCRFRRGLLLSSDEIIIILDIFLREFDRSRFVRQHGQEKDRQVKLANTLPTSHGQVVDRVNVLTEQNYEKKVPVVSSLQLVALRRLQHSAVFEDIGADRGF